MNIDKVIGGMLALIALYLVASNAKQVNTVLSGLAGFIRPTVQVLQARDAKYSG